MSGVKKAVDQAAVQRLQGVIQRTVEQYKSDPESARATFRATARIVEGFETTASMRGFEVTIDEPEELGGTNTGPNPVEVLLGALGTCQEIVLAAYAAALGIELESVKIEARGDIDLRGLFSVADVPAGFESITFDAEIEAPGATAEQLEQLKSLGLAHCPVLDTLKRPIDVETNYRFNGAGEPLAQSA